MLNKNVILILLLMMFSGVAILADDQKNDGPFSLDFKAGVEYDSNVAVLELDASSGESDLAAIMDLGLGFDKNVNERFKVNFGYDFSQSLHEEFDNLDIRIHRGSAGMELDLGGVNAGVSAQYADATLDDAGFLTLEQISPSISKLFGKKVFARLAYDLIEKEFDSAPERNATAESPALDLFIFTDGVSRYFVLGYRHHDEDADDDEFDYTGGKVKLQFNKQTMWGSKKVKFKAEARYEFRDYTLDALILGEPREDDRYHLKLQYEIPLTDKVYLEPRVEYSDYQSNLSSVNFDEQVAAIQLGVRL